MPELIAAIFGTFIIIEVAALCTLGGIFVVRMMQEHGRQS